MKLRLISLICEVTQDESYDLSLMNFVRQMIFSMSLKTKNSQEAPAGCMSKAGCKWQEDVKTSREKTTSYVDDIYGGGAYNGLEWSSFGM